MRQKQKRVLGKVRELKFSHAAIRRMAHRAGIVSMAKPVYDDIQGEIKSYLRGVISAAVTNMEHNRRKTVSAEDVVKGLAATSKKMIYGISVPLTR